MEGRKNIMLKEYSRPKTLLQSNVIHTAQRQAIPAYREGGLWKKGV